MPDAVPYNEPELLLQVANGSATAFQRLFEAYEKRILLYAQRVTGDTAIAEDITQDIFLQIWISRQRLAGVQNFNAYLHKAARNTALNAMKKLARQALVTEYLRRETTTADNTEAHTRLLSQEVRQEIQKLVDQLTPRQREIFLMSREEGLRQEEIATRLGLSISTVKSHMVDALRILRQGLQEQYGPDALILAVIFQLMHL